jgi:hypothetical protein
LVERPLNLKFRGFLLINLTTVNWPGKYIRQTYKVLETLQVGEKDKLVWACKVLDLVDII